ncbi:YlbF family regulator [Desulfoscipio sp. XC116]|uniref:YlbF family regulator n=1 Tax=Desulfoscipio sp. XC116 TaxID=3144975 RepID=UPI00325A6F71
MSKDVFEKASALGKSIVESEEFKEIQKKENEMIGDPNAQQLLKKFHELQKLQKEKQKKGEALTPDEAREFEQVQLKIVENKAIKTFSEAQEKFQNMMNEIMKIIKEAGVNKIKE